MSEQPINHPSRGAERRFFQAACGDEGNVYVDGDFIHASLWTWADDGGARMNYQRINVVDRDATREPDGATLTERLLMRLVSDQEVYWRQRDRRDRVRRQRRGGANGEGE